MTYGEYFRYCVAHYDYQVSINGDYATWWAEDYMSLCNRVGAWG